MGFLSSYDGTEIVDVSDLVGADAGTWTVTVKKSLTNKDYLLAKQYLSRVISGKSVPDIAGHQRELVVAAVVDWNLTDASDNPLPVFPVDAKRKSIERLPEQVFTRIYRHVNDANSDRTEDEDATFPQRADAVNDEGNDLGSAGIEALLAQESPLGETGA